MTSLGLAVACTASATGNRVVADEHALPPRALDPGIEERLGDVERAVRIDRIVIVGNSVLDEATLETLTAPYTGRRLRADELIALRDAISAEYVQRGFVTSRASIPPQDVAGGVLRVEMRERGLQSVRIDTDGRLRRRYLEQRVPAAAAVPLDAFALEAQLQRLLQDPRIEQLEAALEVVDASGGVGLSLDVVESPAPYRVAVWAANDLPAAIGAGQARLRTEHLNLLGWGDRLSLAYGVSRGLEDVELAYDFDLYGPVRLDLGWRHSQIEIVEDRFETLDIESRFQRFRAGLSLPLVDRNERSVLASVAAEHLRADASLLGFPFSFDPGAQRGESRIWALRGTLEASRRTRSRVIAARSVLSVGLDGPGATRHSGDRPDGRFVHWIGQLSYAQRLPLPGLQGSARLQAQLSADPLLALEQAAIGGQRTVRGYPELRLVRDNVVVGAVELLFELPTPRSDTAFALVPFFDFGHAWNTDRPTEGPRSIASVGIGLRGRIFDRLFLRFDWGYRLRDVETTDDELQDAGVHLGIELRVP